MTLDASAGGPITLALCGDVMVGRGIDQILPHPGDPTLYEPAISNAASYVALARRASGPIDVPVAPDYIWGDALAMLDEAAPDLRLINLETAITTSDTPWPGKQIHYRMHPANIPCLTAARVDCCVLANNHVLDWGYAGLHETLRSVRGAGMLAVGAGLSQAEAAAPAVMDLAGAGRVLIFAWGLPSSGVPAAWAATEEQPGVNWLADPSPRAVSQVAAQIAAARRPGDLVVVSLHWGGNWGYYIPRRHRAFAQQLIAAAGADIVYGHSSHHPLGIEVYQGRLILYGCGDLINDYEGIGGHEVYRPDLGLIVLATLDRAGRLVRGRLLPVRRRRLRLWRAAPEEALWLSRRLSREGRTLGTRVELQPDGSMSLSWRQEPGP